MSNEQQPPNGLSKALHAVGVTQVGIHSFSPETVEARRLQISKATRLRDLVDEYVFYTPGLLFSKIPNAPDLTASFIEETGVDTIPFSLAIDKQLFGGLELLSNGDPSWNHVLYAMEREHWDAYVAWIGTVAINHREQGLLWRVRTQELRIFDPFGTITLATRPTAEDAVPVTAFVLESSQGSYVFHDSSVYPTAYFDRTMKFADTAVFEKAIQEGQPNPYGVVDENCNPDALGGGV